MSSQLDLDLFLSMTTTTGFPVRNIRMQGGHFLVYKIPMGDSPNLLLPDMYKKKAIKNIVSIKGFVIRATEPFCPKKAKQYWVWDKDQEMEVPKYRTISLPRRESEVEAGVCILYSSYNVGKVTVQDMYEPLVIIREVDILASWAPEEDSKITLGDHTMDQKAYEYT